MKEIITSRIEKLKREIEKFFEKDNVGLDEAEVYLSERLHQKATTAKVIEHSLGLPHPDMVASMPVKSGKVTLLYRLLNSLNR